MGDYEVGQKMIKDRSFEQNSDYFSSVFEIGRRHKILNPECMRTDYGKLVHMLMDSQNPDIQRLLEFKLVKKVRTVYDFLKEHDALSMLKHADVLTATTAIVDRGRTRQEVQQAIKVKEAAVKRLIRKFSNDDFGEEEIEWCLYSLGDNSSFLVFNRDPVDQMISYLTKHFPENLEADSPRSLAIRAGPQQGAVCADDRETHARDPPPLSKEAWVLDWVKCCPPWRPQCTQRTYLYRQVHTGASDP